MTYKKIIERQKAAVHDALYNSYYIYDNEEEDDDDNDDERMLIVAVLVVLMILKGGERCTNVPVMAV